MPSRARSPTPTIDQASAPQCLCSITRMNGERGGDPRFGRFRALPLLARCCSGAHRDVRLDSPPAILREVPLRLIGLAAVLIVSLVLAPLAAGSQPVGKPARFGGLCLISCEGPGLDAFRGTLRDLDYIEGRTLAFE
jgi:hypothetical protein